MASKNQPNNVGNGELKRWQHHLNPELTKDKWSTEDNIKLFDLHKKYGSHWKEIAAQFEKRTDNGIKNQFFSIIRKSLRKACKFCGLSIAPSMINYIKPKILSEFLNSDSIKASQNKPNNPSDVPPILQFKISDLIQKFAFVKVWEIDSDLKQQLKDVLSQKFAKLKELK